MGSLDTVRVCALYATDLPNIDNWPKNPAPDSYVHISLFSSSLDAVAGPWSSAQVDNTNNP